MLLGGVGCSGLSRALLSFPFSTFGAGPVRSLPCCVTRGGPVVSVSGGCVCGYWGMEPARGAEEPCAREWFASGASMRRRGASVLASEERCRVYRGLGGGAIRRVCSFVGGVLPWGMDWPWGQKCRGSGRAACLSFDRGESVCFLALRLGFFGVRSSIGLSTYFITVIRG